MTSRIVLIGMMGSGKTTVGQLLAERLGWGWADSDAQVETAVGMSVKEIFARDGEAAFRALESEALRQALSGATPIVVAAAGGTVLDPANRELMNGQASVVWLRADPQALATRIGDGSGRPLLEGDPLGNLRSLDAVRRPLYASVAEVIVDVEELSPAQIVDAIVARVPSCPNPERVP